MRSPTLAAALAFLVAVASGPATAQTAEPPVPRPRLDATFPAAAQAFAAPQAARPNIFQRLAAANAKAKARQEEQKLAREERRRAQREARVRKASAAAIAAGTPTPVLGPEGASVAFKPMAHKGSTTLVAFQEIGPVPGRGRCGIENGLRVSALTRHRVAVTPSAKINAQTAAATAVWLRESAVPAAEREFGVALKGVVNAASYVCRTRNHRKGGRLSEHSFGNALDIRAFVLADGRRVAVKRQPKGSAEARFLAAVRKEACAYFTTVLGPGSDGSHADHFHFDLARHTPSGDYRHCR